MIINSTNINTSPITAYKAKEAQNSKSIPKMFVNAFPKSVACYPPSVIRKRISNERTSLLTPIKSEEEYNKILNDMYSYTYYSCGAERNFFDDSGYEDIPENMKALALYCGLNDKSYLINSWLSGRRKERYKSMDDEKIANSIRAMEYSLKKLDEKHGKFEGKVFRNGYFDPITDRQYYSASDVFNCVKKFSHHADAVKFKPYSIIKTKNAHKIYEYQNDANSQLSLNFKNLEHEVLIDRKSKFRKVPKEEYTAEDIKDIKMILKKAYHIKPWQMNFEKLDKKYGLASSITIWEEI